MEYLNPTGSSYKDEQADQAATPWLETFTIARMVEPRS